MKKTAKTKEYQKRKVLEKIFDEIKAHRLEIRAQKNLSKKNKLIAEWSGEEQENNRDRGIEKKKLKLQFNDHMVKQRRQGATEDRQTQTVR